MPDDDISTPEPAGAPAPNRPGAAPAEPAASESGGPASAAAVSPEAGTPGEKGHRRPGDEPPAGSAAAPRKAGPKGRRTPDLSDGSPPPDTAARNDEPATDAADARAEAGRPSSTARFRKPDREHEAGRTLSVRISTLIGVAAILVFAVATCVTTALWLSARGDLQDREQIASDERHAEQIATDYALGASTIDFQDLDSWVTRLKANTVAELGNKFDATAPKLKEILIPLKWTSSAQPIAARVTSTDADGAYHVSVFLDVDSTNAQSPDSGRMTVTYNVTVHRNAGWKVTDVGGMEGALPVR